MCDESIKSIRCACVVVVLAHNRQLIQTMKDDTAIIASSFLTGVVASDYLLH